MISRRTLIAAGAAAGALHSLPALAAAPVPGKDYIIVRPPLDLRSPKIVVHDFFAYTCPHCLQFAPYMEKLAHRLASMPDVEYVRSPVAWNDDLQLFSRAWFCFEALRRTDVELRFWEWVIKGNHTWKGPKDIEQEITAWIVANAGINENTWKSAAASFGVTAKYRSAQQRWQQYGLDSTPTVGIDGKYMAAPHLSGTVQGAVDTALFLIDKVRRERS